MARSSLQRANYSRLVLSVRQSTPRGIQKGKQEPQKPVAADIKSRVLGVPRLPPEAEFLLGSIIKLELLRVLRQVSIDSKTPDVMQEDKPPGGEA